MATQKRYNLSHTTLTFTDKPDTLTLDDDPDTLRAEMSCGHAVTPQSLTDYCCSLLNQGQYEFTCPALVDDTNQKCEKEWPYTEVRALALLTDKEQEFFEETLPVLAAARYCEYKSCPGCQTFVERIQLTNLSVRCTICTAEKGYAYKFCWQCLKTWKGPAPRSDMCANEGCVNPQLNTLAMCRTIAFSQVKTPEGSAVQCPALRACPTCGLFLEHDTFTCKIIVCVRCQKAFCFFCLKLKAECLKTSNYFNLCTVAEKQTSIPSWVK